MSRLRRLQLSGRIFFVTCSLLRTRTKFGKEELEILAGTFHVVRTRWRFLLAGYVLMPDHWHAMILPGPGDRLDRLMDSLKVAATRRINSYRKTRGSLWHARYFDCMVRSVKEFHETLDYMHLNPVTRGLVNHPGDWAWSSYHCFGGSQPARLEVDNLSLPLNQDAHL